MRKTPVVSSSALTPEAVASGSLVPREERERPRAMGRGSPVGFHQLGSCLSPVAARMADSLESIAIGRMSPIAVPDPSRGKARRIWIANGEEVTSPRRSEDEPTVLSKVRAFEARYLFYPTEDDLLISFSEPRESFMEYLTGLLGYSKPPRVLFPRRVSSPYFLIDSVLADDDLMARLRAITAGGQWSLEPHYESRRVLLLADSLGLGFSRTRRDLVVGGLIDQCNDKEFFKRLADELDIPRVPGVCVETLEEVSAALLSSGPGSSTTSWMLRKAVNAGGLGNLFGDRESLLKALPTYCTGGRILVEPFLDLSLTLGSLVRLSEEGCFFVGIDSQRIEEAGWTGFSYPYIDDRFAGTVRDYSLRIAARMHRNGARGYLNLDFGVVRNGETERSLVALESNLRHNGFSHILDLAGRYFQDGPPPRHIQFVSNVTVSSPGITFPGLLGTLRAITVDGESVLIEGRGRIRGVIPILPAYAGSCGLAIFGETADYVDRVHEAAVTALA